MDANIELGSYSRESGLRLVWVPGYTLTVVAGADGVTVCGNSEGLRSLAQHLLTLADDVVPFRCPRTYGARTGAGRRLDLSRCREEGRLDLTDCRSKNTGAVLPQKTRSASTRPLRRGSGRPRFENGYAASDFPGTPGEVPDGLAYFARDKSIADEFADSYGEDHRDPSPAKCLRRAVRTVRAAVPRAALAPRFRSPRAQ